MMKKNKYHENYTIRAKDFNLYTIKQNKKSLSPFDNKRYLINNIENIPYCNKDDTTIKENSY